MKSVSNEKLERMNAKLNEKYGMNITLKLKTLDNINYHGFFAPDEDVIVINTEVTDKGGTLCHEWAHCLVLKLFGREEHQLKFARIQKYLMIRFKIKFREDVWKAVKSLNPKPRRNFGEVLDQERGPLF